MDTGAGMQIATKSVTVEKKVKRKVTVNPQKKRRNHKIMIDNKQTICIEDQDF